MLESRAGQAAATLLVIICLMLIAVHPLTFGAMPDTPDGLLHLYRLVALDHAIRQGDLWPRYVPGLHFGYGSPIFNYYAPLSLYPLEALHLLSLSFLDALLLGMGLYTIGGAIGAYLLGRAWGGPLTGIVTMIAFCYAPYTLYDWPRRGAVAEFAALMLLPWLLWAFRRLSIRGRRGDLTLAVAFFSALILTHNITALYSFPLLLVYCAYLWWVAPDPPRALVRMGIALVLSLGLTTFFWLPALAEARYVHIDRVSTAVADLDFHNNFDSLTEVVALPRTADLTQLHPPVPRSLGWPQIILALVGVALFLSWTRFLNRQNPADPLHRHAWIPLMLVLFLGLLFLMTRASIWIWEIVPLMRFIQFPWRLLGPASLTLALLAGAGVTLVESRIPWTALRIAWPPICLLSMIVYAMPWLYGIYLPDPPADSIVDAQNFERKTGWIGATAAGEYVPIWTTQLPDMNRLIGLYAQGEIIPRLQPAPAISIEEMDWGAMRASLAFTARADTSLIFDWLYFPGWWARLDGAPVTIRPTDPQGLIVIDIPQGQHTLEIGFGPTPLRLGAIIASGVFLVGLVVVLLLWRRLWPVSASGTGWADATLHIVPLMMSAALLGLALLAAKALLIDNLETPIKRARFANGLEAGLQTPVLADFSHQITLLGYDLPRTEARSGTSTRLALYWQLAGDMIDENYSSIVYLRDGAGNIVSQTGSQHPGNWPTRDWVPGFYVQERLSLDVPPATPPGIYSIHVALYSHLARRNLDIFDVAGNPLGVTVEIGTLTVTRPWRPPRLAALEIERPLHARLLPDLILIGVNPLPTDSEVGHPFALIAYWQVRRELDRAYLARLLWLTKDGEVAARSPAFSPVVGYDTDLWQRGDLWRGLHVLHVPGSLSAGNYEVVIQLIDRDGNVIGQQATIVQMRVNTPPRTFVMPDVDVEADILWQNGIRLAGYDLPDTVVGPQDTVSLTLYWQPQNEITESLFCFVHLIDQTGRIVTQHDQMPLGGTRPTTGWAPGEVLQDPYKLLIQADTPPDVYHIRIGWYDAISGQRVRLVDGSDSWIIPATIHVR